VVIEDEGLFGPSYPNVILVPLTEDAGLAIPGLAEPLDPTAENGCTKRCFALAPFVACTSAAAGACYAISRNVGSARANPPAGAEAIGLR
jgi:hypothetical protein